MKRRAKISGSSYLWCLVGSSILIHLKLCSSWDQLRSFPSNTKRILTLDSLDSPGTFGHQEGMAKNDPGHGKNPQAIKAISWLRPGAMEGSNKDTKGRVLGCWRWQFDEFCQGTTAANKGKGLDRRRMTKICTRPHGFFLGFFAIEAWPHPCLSKSGVSCKPWVRRILQSCNSLLSEFGDKQNFNKAVLRSVGHPCICCRYSNHEHQNHHNCHRESESNTRRCQSLHWIWHVHIGNRQNA